MDAAQLKDEGNRLFKQGRFAEAAKIYAKAEKASQKDPVFPSNLSAALYEIGDYPGSIEAILRSWRLLSASESPNPSLALRLSTRLPKALCQAAHSGARLAYDPAAIDALEKVAVDAQGGDASAAGITWEDWRRTEADMKDPETGKKARARFAKLPIFKHPTKPLREFYKMGQDPPMSLLDDWGTDPKYMIPISLKTATKDRLSNLSFLYGGVGDARHVYGTLIGLARAFDPLASDRKKLFKAHLTLLDVHPAALSRDLCIVLLIQDLIDAEKKKNAAILKAEIVSTMMFIFVAVVMPDYCYKRLHDTISRLRKRLEAGETDLTDWIHVDSKSIAPIITALDFWIHDASTRNTSTMLDFHTPEERGSSLAMMLNSPALDPSFKAIIQGRLDHNKRLAESAFNQMSRSQLASMGVPRLPSKPTPAQRKEYETVKEVVIKNMAEMILKDQGNMDNEARWYQKTRAFIPPPELWDRHPGFEDYRSLATLKIDTKALESIRFGEIADHVELKWKPNTTLFADLPEKYPQMRMDPFETPIAINRFNERMSINSTKQSDTPLAPAYGHFLDFFGAVADAIKRMRGRVKLEFVHGELTQVLSHMSLRSDDSRPEEYPRSFTRIWLSNVPDYTHGPLNTIVYALPCLQFGQGCAAGANSLLNTGIWKDDEEFIYTYTQLRSIDTERFLGCHFDATSYLHGVALLSNNKLPRPLPELASRPELISWLTRVLIYTLLPGTNGPMAQFRVRLPNNLTAFLALLIHLTRVGFPPHWLSDLLTAVLSGSITTDIAPYLGKWPIPVSDTARRVKSRTVRTDPWGPDLENVLCLAGTGLPFAVAGLSARRPENIGTYTAKVNQSANSAFTMMLGPIMNDPCVALLFYKKSLGMSEAAVIAALPRIFEGTQNPPVPVGSVYVLTSFEAFAPPVVKFRMSRALAEKMMKEKWWCVVAYRTDTDEAVTMPAYSANWVQVDE